MLSLPHPDMVWEWYLHVSWRFHYHQSTYLVLLLSSASSSSRSFADRPLLSQKPHRPIPALTKTCWLISWRRECSAITPDSSRVHPDSSRVLLTHHVFLYSYDSSMSLHLPLWPPLSSTASFATAEISSATTCCHQRDLHLLLLSLPLPVL